MSESQKRGPLRTRRFWKSLEAAAQGRLRGARRAALLDEVRNDEASRRDYDRTFDVLRALEGAPVAAAEYGTVEDWLMDDLQAQPAAEGARWWKLTWLGVAGALAAALVLTVVSWDPNAGRDDGWGVRGSGDDHGLAIEALCPQRTLSVGRRDGLVPATEFGCALQDTLSFAYRVDSAVALAPGGTLSLFGIDGDGDVQYYAPTPTNASGMPIRLGAWQPLPWVIELDVNHVAGEVVLYGLVSERPPTVAEVDALADALSHLPAAGVGDPPWHKRLLESPALQPLCSGASRCESAELPFTLHSMTSPNVDFEDQP